MIAFVAAEPYEYAPLERRRTCPDWFCLAEGAGFQMARRAAERAVARRATALVSIGVCGALDPALRTGDIVVDASGGEPRTRRTFAKGRVVSQDRVAVTAREKRELAGQGIAVEMESAAVRAVAQQYHLNFYSVKAVSDIASDEMPLDFNAYRDAEGRFRKARIACAALARPWVIPRLMHLQKNAAAAAEKLGEFLVHCEF